MNNNIDPLLEEYLDRDLRASTKRNYRIHLETYQKVTGLTLTELIEEAESEEDLGIRPRNRKIKKHLKKFHKYLENEDYTTLSVKINLSSIRSFYRYFDIELPNQRSKYKKDKINITTDDLPGKKEIKKALKFSNIKYQAIILTMSSSAMGASEVVSLKVKDLIKGLGKNVSLKQNGLIDINKTREILDLKKNNVITWTVTRQKTGQKYITFSTPEALEAILNYLESEPPSSPHDGLFRAKARKKLAVKSLYEYFRKLNVRCGWKKIGTQSYFRSHHLRKFWANQMEKRALGYKDSRLLMGHASESIQGSTGAAYFKPDHDHLRQQYIQSMDAVMINWKVKTEIVNDAKLEKMEEKIRKLEEEDQKKNELLDAIINDPNVLKELQKKKIS
ncbi:MAG: tyrosine-type recombinase/integrase [Methanobacterium sp.]|jgi:integrase